MRVQVLVSAIILLLLYTFSGGHRHSEHRHRRKRGKRGGDLFAGMMDARWGSIAPGMVLLILFLAGIAATGFALS